jgi:PAS domain S-box-containing protein
VLRKSGCGERPAGAVSRRGPANGKGPADRFRVRFAGVFRPRRLRRSLHSLPLQLGVFFVALLVTAALAVGYLFDRGRSEALEQRSLATLRLHGERAADDLQRRLERLQRDTLFLARAPAALGLLAALHGGAADPDARAALTRWRERLQQLFLAFVESRPEYFQLRLVETANGGRELVRVERVNGEPKIIPEADLPTKDDSHSVRKAASLAPGEVYLSRLDLSMEHGRVRVPHLPTVRAATPVGSAGGAPSAVVVVNMDVQETLARLRVFIQGSENAYLVDDRGNFLLHPDAARAFGTQLGRAYRLQDAFPAEVVSAVASAPAGGGFFSWGKGDGRTVGYVTSRAFPTGDPGFKLSLVLTEPEAALAIEVGPARRESLLWMGALLLTAILLVAFMVRGLTHSLRSLVRASEAIAAGDYGVRLPEVVGGEVAALTAGFRRMVSEIRSRERALEEVNKDLERRVEERTRALSDSSQALKRQHELQRLILENIGDGVVVSDRDGRFLLWNRGAERIVGGRPPDVAPHQWPEHFGVFRNESGTLVPAEELPLVRAMRGEATEPVQLYLQGPRGEHGRWVTATGRPLLGPDNAVEGGVITLIDITEQKRLQRRLEQNRSELASAGKHALMAEIAAAAAHQLSQPIAAMAGYIGALEQLQEMGQLSGERLAEILGDMTRVAGRAGDTLNSLRTLIRRRQVVPARIDVNELVTSALSFLGERLLEDNVAVVRELGSNLPKLCGDPVELEQMLTQLVANAVDALQGTPCNQRRLLISTAHDSDANRIVIRVADSGEGISPGVADRLFEPWVTSKADALGIGLSIARTIVENHGGKIGVQLEEPPGAVFRIELPAMIPLS